MKLEQVKQTIQKLERLLDYEDLKREEASPTQKIALDFFEAAKNPDLSLKNKRILSEKAAQLALQASEGKNSALQEIFNSTLRLKRANSSFKEFWESLVELGLTEDQLLKDLLNCQSKDKDEQEEKFAKVVLRNKDLPNDLKEKIVKLLCEEKDFVHLVLKLDQKDFKKFITQDENNKKAIIDNYFKHKSSSARLVIKELIKTKVLNFRRKTKDDETKPNYFYNKIIQKHDQDLFLEMLEQVSDEEEELDFNNNLLTLVNSQDRLSKSMDPQNELRFFKKLTSLFPALNIKQTYKKVFKIKTFELAQHLFLSAINYHDEQAVIKLLEVFRDHVEAIKFYYKDEENGITSKIYLGDLLFQKVLKKQFSESIIETAFKVNRERLFTFSLKEYGEVSEKIIMPFLLKGNLEKDPQLENFNPLSVDQLLENVGGEPYLSLVLKTNAFNLQSLMKKIDAAIEDRRELQILDQFEETRLYPKEPVDFNIDELRSDKWQKLFLSLLKQGKVKHLLDFIENLITEKKITQEEAINFQKRLLQKLGSKPGLKIKAVESYFYLLGSLDRKDKDEVLKVNESILEVLIKEIRLDLIAPFSKASAIYKKALECARKLNNAEAFLYLSDRKKDLKELTLANEKLAILTLIEEGKTDKLISYLKELPFREQEEVRKIIFDKKNSFICQKGYQKAIENSDLESICFLKGTKVLSNLEKNGKPFLLDLLQRKPFSLLEALEDDFLLSYRDAEGKTLAHYAVESGNETLFQHLINKDPHFMLVPDKEKETSFELALKKKPHFLAYCQSVLNAKKLWGDLSEWINQKSDSTQRMNLGEIFQILKADEKNWIDLIDCLVASENFKLPKEHLQHALTILNKSLKSGSTEIETNEIFANRRRNLLKGGLVDKFLNRPEVVEEKEKNALKNEFDNFMRRGELKGCRGYVIDFINSGKELNDSEVKKISWQTMKDLLSLAYVNKYARTFLNRETNMKNILKNSFGHTYDHVIDLLYSGEILKDEDLEEIPKEVLQAFFPFSIVVDKIKLLFDQPKVLGLYLKEVYPAEDSVVIDYFCSDEKIEITEEDLEKVSRELLRKFVMDDFYWKKPVRAFLNEPVVSRFCLRKRFSENLDFLDSIYSFSTKEPNMEVLNTFPKEMFMTLLAGEKCFNIIGDFFNHPVVIKRFLETLSEANETVIELVISDEGKAIKKNDLKEISMDFLIEVFNLDSVPKRISSFIERKEVLEIFLKMILDKENYFLIDKICGSKEPIEEKDLKEVSWDTFTQLSKYSNKLNKIKLFLERPEVVRAKEAKNLKMQLDSSEQIIIDQIYFEKEINISVLDKLDPKTFNFLLRFRDQMSAVGSFLKKPKVAKILRKKMLHLLVHSPSLIDFIFSKDGQKISEEELNKFSFNYFECKLFFPYSYYPEVKSFLYQPAVVKSYFKPKTDKHNLNDRALNLLFFEKDEEVPQEELEKVTLKEFKTLYEELNNFEIIKDFFEKPEVIIEYLIKGGSYLQLAKVDKADLSNTYAQRYLKSLKAVSENSSKIPDCKYVPPEGKTLYVDMLDKFYSLPKVGNKGINLSGIQNIEGEELTPDEHLHNLIYFLELVEDKKTIAGITPKNRDVKYGQIELSFKHLMDRWNEIDLAEKISLMTQFSRISTGYCIDPRLKAATFVYQNLPGSEKTLSLDPVATLQNNLRSKFQDLLEVILLQTYSVIKSPVYVGEIDTHADNLVRTNLADYGFKSVTDDIYLNSEGRIKLHYFMRGYSDMPSEGVFISLMSMLETAFLKEMEATLFQEFCKFLQSEIQKEGGEGYETLKNYYELLLSAEENFVIGELFGSAKKSIGQEYIQGSRSIKKLAKQRKSIEGDINVFWRARLRRIFSGKNVSDFNSLDEGEQKKALESLEPDERSSIEKKYNSLQKLDDNLDQLKSKLKKLETEVKEFKGYFHKFIEEQDKKREAFQESILLDSNYKQYVSPKLAWEIYNLIFQYDKAKKP